MRPTRQVILVGAVLAAVSGCVPNGVPTTPPSVVAPPVTTTPAPTDPSAPAVPTQSPTPSPTRPPTPPAAGSQDVPKETDGTPIAVRPDASPVPAGAVHVDGDAAPGGDGSAGAPFPTLRAALGAVAAGGTVVLAGGTYREGGLDVAQAVTIRSAPGAQVWIKGSDVVDGFVPDPAAPGLHRRDGFTLDLPRAREFPGCDSDHNGNGVPDCLVSNDSLADRREALFLDGRALRQVGSRGEVDAGSFYLDHAADRLYLGQDPAGHVVETTTRETGVTFRSARADGAVLRGVGLAHFPDRALSAQQARVTWDANTVVHSNGLRLDGAKGSLVRGNVVAYSDQKAIGGQFLDGTVIEGNHVHDSNTAGFNAAWGGAAVKFLNTTGLTVQGNTVERTAGTGIWFDIAANQITAVGNLVRDNDAIGIFFEISNEALIAGNVAVDNGAGFQVTLSSNARVWNNTGVGNRTCLAVGEYRRTLRPDETGAGAGTAVTGNQVVNNLCADSEGPHVSVTSHQARCGSFFTRFDGNGYVRTDPAAGGGHARWCNERPATLAAFQQLTGLDGASVERAGAADTPFADDRFVPTGWALGAGRPLPVDVAEALRVPAGAPVDLGARRGAGCADACGWWPAGR